MSENDSELEMKIGAGVTGANTIGSITVVKDGPGAYIFRAQGDVETDLIRRMFAAYDACVGIPNEALKDGKLGELIEQIGPLLDCFRHGHRSEFDVGMDMLKDAFAALRETP